MPEVLQYYYLFIVLINKYNKFSYLVFVFRSKVQNVEPQRTIVYNVTSQYYASEVTLTQATLLFQGLLSVTLESCLYRYGVTPSNTGRGKRHEKITLGNTVSPSVNPKSGWGNASGGLIRKRVLSMTSSRGTAQKKLK